MQRLGSVANQAIVIAFLIVNLGHHGRHYGFVGVILFGHGQVGAGGGVVTSAIAEIASVVGAGIFVLALHLLIAVEQQAGFLVILLLEIAIAKLKIGLGPLVVAQVVGSYFLKVASGRRVVFLVEIKLTQLKIGRSRTRVGRMLRGKGQNQPLGIGVRKVEAAHGVVVLGVGGAVAGSRAGLAGVHRLNGQIRPKRLLRRAVLAPVKQFQALLEMPLVGSEHLGLLGLGGHGGRST